MLGVCLTNLLFRFILLLMENVRIYAQNFSSILFFYHKFLNSRGSTVLFCIIPNAQASITFLHEIFSYFRYQASQTFCVLLIGRLTIKSPQSGDSPQVERRVWSIDIDFEKLNHYNFCQFRNGRDTVVPA